MEYMMGNLVNSSGEMYASYSGFSTYPNKRYYDKYSYGISSTEYTRGKLGDATKEMSRWYSDYASFPTSYNPWFMRGGDFSNGSNAGLFGFDGSRGNANVDISARAVISPIS